MSKNSRDSLLSSSFVLCMGFLEDSIVLQVGCGAQLNSNIEMSNISSATYIKKLVKMIYEKERQMEELKRSLKHQEKRQPPQIDQQIRIELQCASTQLREVNTQINAMELKMQELAEGLQEEISKNAELEDHITQLQNQNTQLRATIMQLQQQIQDQSVTAANLMLQIQQKQVKVESLNQENTHLLGLLERTTSKHTKTKETTQNYQKELGLVRQALKDREKELTTRKEELNGKNEQIQTIKEEFKTTLQSKEEQIKDRSIEIKKCMVAIEKLKELQDISIQQIKEKDQQIEQYRSDIEIAHTLSALQNQTLTNYQQFAYQITQYIESAYLRYCCQPYLRPSKKLIKEENESRLEMAYKHFNSLQSWMQEMAERVEQMMPQFGQTVENISVIVRSFEEKLEICDLTEKLEKEKEEMDKEEEQLLAKYQKECQKSYERDRTKMVQLDEVKEVLRMTKDVNRELMQEINHKEYIIMQCRKAYASLLPPQSPQHQLLRQMLNIKQT